jgi:hypothetical protein
MQVVTQTQSGPALVMDLTASPFYEPGPLPQCLAALMGLSVTPTDDPAAVAAAATAAAAAEPAAGSSGDALAVAALSVLQAAEWKRAEKLIKGLKVGLDACKQWGLSASTPPPPLPAHAQGSAGI